MKWPVAAWALVFLILCGVSIVSTSRLLGRKDMQPVERQEDSLRILIVPAGVSGRMGSVARRKLLGDLADELAESLRVDYEVTEAVELPARHLEAARDQVEARRALATLSARLRSESCFRVLFVTGEDLYLPGFNFIFGLAAPGGRAALVSSARFGERWAGRVDSEGKLQLERLTKVALHELGHTLLLGHSEHPQSVMKYHNSLAELDSSGYRLTDEDLEAIRARFPELEGRLHRIP